MQCCCRRACSGDEKKPAPTPPAVVVTPAVVRHPPPAEKLSWSRRWRPARPNPPADLPSALRRAVAAGISARAAHGQARLRRGQLLESADASDALGAYRSACSGKTSSRGCRKVATLLDRGGSNRAG